MNDIEPCPDCGEPLDYDEVDIGVGMQRGNYGCPNCGWVPKPYACGYCGSSLHADGEIVHNDGCNAPEEL
jgi:primosomal protein N'